MTDTKDITRRPAEEDPPVLQLFDQYKPDLEAALPKEMGLDHFKSVCTNLLRQNPQLLNCDPMSFVLSTLLAAQLGLVPGPPLGLSWIIPRRNKGRMEASMQIGYEGYREMVYRSQMVKTIDAFVVNDGDDFEWMRGRGGVDWHHKPLGEPGREWTDVYAVAELMSGAEMFRAWTRAEVLAHRDRYVPHWKKSDSWVSEEDKMGRKSVLIQLCKNLPRSVEVRQALVADGATPREIRPDLAGMLALEADTEDSDKEGDDAHSDS